VDWHKLQFRDSTGSGKADCEPYGVSPLSSVVERDLERLPYMKDDTEDVGTSQ